jgi:hypothetical protein
LDVTLHNDGNVDVDTAALTISVFGAKGPKLALRSTVTPTEIDYRAIPESAWTTLASSGRLLDGAVGGHRREHILLRPGDSFPLPRLIVVPRGYDILWVHFSTVFGRYPIAPRIAVSLQQNARDGVVTLKSNSVTIDLSSYFGV